MNRSLRGRNGTLVWSNNWKLLSVMIYTWRNRSIHWFIIPKSTESCSGGWGESDIFKLSNNINNGSAYILLPNIFLTALGTAVDIPTTGCELVMPHRVGEICEKCHKHMHPRTVVAFEEPRRHSPEACSSCLPLGAILFTCGGCKLTRYCVSYFLVVSGIFESL